MRKKQHLVFCCSSQCAHHELETTYKAMARLGLLYKVIKPEFSVETETDRWVYLFDYDRQSEKLMGRIIDSWETCGRAFINQELRDFLRVQTGREKL